MPQLGQRARSSAREDDGLDCRLVFGFGFVTCSRSRTPRPPVVLTTPGLISSIPAASSAADQLHQRIDVAADDAVAGLHALDGRHRKVRQFGHLPLIDVQERARGPELIGGNHEGGFSVSGPGIFMTI